MFIQFHTCPRVPPFFVLQGLGAHFHHKIPWIPMIKPRFLLSIYREVPCTSLRRSPRDTLRPGCSMASLGGFFRGFMVDVTWECVGKMVITRKHGGFMVDLWWKHGDYIR